LRDGQAAPKPPDQTALVKFLQCIRANGVPDYPDPSSKGLSFNVGSGGDLNPNNPTLQNASKICDQKTGHPGFAAVPGLGGASTSQPGGIELTGTDRNPGAMIEDGRNILGLNRTAASARRP
jgi:hypothetical protein